MPDRSLGASAPILCVVLLVLQGTAGCLTGGHEVEAWWSTEYPRLDPRETWDAWPGMDAPDAEAPQTPALEAFVRAQIDEQWDRIDAMPDQARSSGGAQMAAHHLAKANRSLQAGAATWSLGPIFSASSTLTAIQIGEPGAYPDDPDAVDAFLTRERPLEVWHESRRDLRQAWEGANVSAFPLLFGLLEPWRNARIAEGNLLAEEPDGDPTARALPASNLVAFARTAAAVTENATTRPGPAPAEVSNDTFAPLFEAREDLLQVALGTPPVYERENGPMNRLVFWSYRSQTFQSNGLPIAAATAALSALAQGQVLHQLHEDGDPASEEVLEALERLGDVDSPAEVFLADQAWRAYRLAEDSPPFMHVPAAIDAIWPLVDAVYDRVTEGTPVDWTNRLDPHLEMWAETWIQSSREDHEAT